jgi:hypothetical protein
MTKSFSSLTLPSDYEEMEIFIIKNKVKLTEQIVLSMQYALDNNISSIEVFNFANSDFIVILEKSNFIENLNNILNFYIENEKYEFCDKLIKLKKQLEKHEQK